MKHIFMQDTNQSVPISNIFCIGRNYTAHINELGNKSEKEPLVFLKPTSALNLEGAPIILPENSKEIHYETEFVLLIGKSGKRISCDTALSHIAGYGIGLDLTARDLQSAAKTNGLPWTLAKGFDTSACVSKFIAASELPKPMNCEFEMKLNGEMRQQGNTALMLFNIAYLIHYLSTVFTLNEGDLIFTGTPEGVGPLKSGDNLTLDLANIVSASFSVA